MTDAKPTSNPSQIRSSDITPPPELVTLWVESDEGGPDVLRRIATRAAQWGANQELEACCVEVSFWVTKGMAEKIHKIRRPKPLSLKERALQAWAAVEAGTDDQTATAVIRRALEALPE